MVVPPVEVSATARMSLPELVFWSAVTPAIVPVPVIVKSLAPLLSTVIEPGLTTVFSVMVWFAGYVGVSAKVTGLPSTYFVLVVVPPSVDQFWVVLISQTALVPPVQVSVGGASTPVK